MPDDLFPYLTGSVVFRAIFLGLGVLLAIETKHMPQEFNWSKEIAMSIYTMAIILGIGIPLGYALTDSATTVRRKRKHLINDR